jgi:hypothetical protein
MSYITLFGNFSKHIKKIDTASIKLIQRFYFEYISIINTNKKGNFIDEQKYFEIPMNI